MIKIIGSNWARLGENKLVAIFNTTNSQRRVRQHWHSNYIALGNVLGSVMMNPDRCASLFFSRVIVRRLNALLSDAWPSVPSLRTDLLIGFPSRVRRKSALP